MSVRCVVVLASFEWWRWCRSKAGRGWRGGARVVGVGKAKQSAEVREKRGFGDRLRQRVAQQARARRTVRNHTQARERREDGATVA